MLKEIRARGMVKSTKKMTTFASQIISLMNKTQHLSMLVVAFVVGVMSLTVSSCSSDEGKSAVRGTMVGAEGQKVYMDVTGLAMAETCDSTTIKSDGTFTLHGLQQTEPTFYDIRLADGRTFTILLDSAETIEIKADAQKAMLIGNVSFTASPRNETLQEVQVGASQLLKGLNSTGANVDSLSDAIGGFKTKLRNMVFADPRSMVGYYIVMQNIGGYKLFDVMNKADHQIYSAVATSLQLEYPMSEQVKYLCTYVLGARAQQRSQARRDSLMRQAAQLNSPDLTLPDKNGNEVTLSSFRGKKVLLFFWMAADDNARNAHKDLINTYRKYKDCGLVIYSVSFDTSKVLWEAATSAQGMDWVEVCDLKGGASPAAIIYNVQSVPSNYILDEQGNLIGKDLYGTRLDNKLNEVLR